MEPVLKDLCALIRKSTIHYNETCEQHDVVLSEEFQDVYGKYLRKNNYNVDFYEYTAVITTPVGNYMFVPNQWFVIAAYALGVFTELMEYKKILLKICEYLGERPKLFIPRLRDDTPSVNKASFMNACDAILLEYDENNRRVASERLWRFATDYSWWSGNKTIDRGDFYLSVVLNMLGLVNVSQSFVGDIVADYYKGGMSEMVSDLSMFTDSSQGATYAIEDYRDPKDTEALNKSYVPESDPNDNGEEFVISVRSKG